MVIKDLDGTEPVRGGGRMRAVSLALAVGTLVAWAAVSSLVFRGPFAEPKPSESVAPPPRSTPQSFIFLDLASTVGATHGCIVPGSVHQETVFLGGQTVTMTRQLTPSATCAPPRRVPPPPDRIAR